MATGAVLVAFSCLPWVFLAPMLTVAAAASVTQVMGFAAIGIVVTGLCFSLAMMTSFRRQGQGEQTAARFWTIAAVLCGMIPAVIVLLGVNWPQ